MRLSRENVMALLATARSGGGLDAWCDLASVWMAGAEAEIVRLQEELERYDGAAVAAYRAWVQPAGSSDFVKCEAERLLREVLNPKTEK